MSFMARTPVAIFVVSCCYREDKGTKAYCVANLTIPHYQVGFSALFLSVLHTFYSFIKLRFSSQEDRQLALSSALLAEPACLEMLGSTVWWVECF